MRRSCRAPQAPLEDAAISREPWLEPIAPYALRDELARGVLRAAGADPDLADFASHGLLPPRLRTHQFDALQAAARQHVIVTAGTGSGKTEAFLLPLFSLLLRSPAMGPHDAAGRVVGSAEAEFSGAAPARTGGSRRPGTRAVPDERARRRPAQAAAPGARQPRPRTGSTSTAAGTGSTSAATPAARLSPARRDRPPADRLRRALRLVDDRAPDVEHDEQRYFLPQLDGAEMRSRWDMQAHPPDILITNYSMLNVMLLRELEEPIFEQTAEWLASDAPPVHDRPRRASHVPRHPRDRDRVPAAQPAPAPGHRDKPEKVRFLAASASAGGDRRSSTGSSRSSSPPRARFRGPPGHACAEIPDPRSLRRGSTHWRPRAERSQRRRSRSGGALAEARGSVSRCATETAIAPRAQRRDPHRCELAASAHATADADAVVTQACIATASEGPAAAPRSRHGSSPDADDRSARGAARAARRDGYEP